VPPREPYETPEREKEYPEPSMFGILPAYGFFIRHARSIELKNIDVNNMKEDRRPAFVLASVEGIELENCKTAKVSGVPALVMMQAKAVSVTHCAGLAAFQGDAISRKEM